MSFDLDGYVDVATRMAEFFQKYPNGSLRQASPPQIVDVGGKTFVIYTAEAHRHDEDSCPGQGTAWEPVPGKTPYTKDSELMNAETSAWGRAILAVGAADSRSGVASREEVRNRQTSSRSSGQPRQSSGGAVGPTEPQRKLIHGLSGGDKALEASICQEVHGSEIDLDDLPRREVSKVIDELKAIRKGQDRETAARQADKAAAVEAGVASGEEPF